MVAPAGAGPWPTSTVGSTGCCAVANTAVMLPPGPLRWGSTMCSTNAPATAASNALPPRSRTAWEVAVASQWVEALIPNVPCGVGRVVNGCGAVKVMDQPPGRWV